MLHDRVYLVCDLHVPEGYTVIMRVNAPPAPDRLFKLNISTARRIPAPKRVALDRSRRGLSENVSFGVGTFFVTE